MPGKTDRKQYIEEARGIRGVLKGISAWMQERRQSMKAREGRREVLDSQKVQRVQKAKGDQERQAYRGGRGRLQEKKKTLEELKREGLYSARERERAAKEQRLAEEKAEKELRASARKSVAKDAVEQTTPGARARFSERWQSMLRGYGLIAEANAKTQSPLERNKQAKSKESRAAKLPERTKLSQEKLAKASKKELTRDNDFVRNRAAGKRIGLEGLKKVVERDQDTHEITRKKDLEKQQRMRKRLVREREVLQPKTRSAMSR